MATTGAAGADGRRVSDGLLSKTANGRQSSNGRLSDVFSLIRNPDPTPAEIEAIAPILRTRLSVTEPSKEDLIEELETEYLTPRSTLPQESLNRVQQ